VRGPRTTDEPADLATARQSWEALDAESRRLAQQSNDMRAVWQVALAAYETAKEAERTAWRAYVGLLRQEAS
jgi:hypothetical protein